jgi:glycosyltransferase involved in cell wall biosynthesis
VFEFPWCDDFAAARNECIRHARGDFIFWMDADESIDSSNREKLRLLFNTLPRHGDTETGRHGEKNDTETGRQGDAETGRQGDTGTGRHGDTETGRQGEKNDTGTRGRGDTETRRPGDKETQPQADRLPLTTHHSRMSPL